MIVDDASVDEKEKLVMIDAFQRLGISYHFESEIELQLHNMSSHVPMHNMPDSMINFNHDLYSVALWFRLLRQQGLHVSPEIFEKFKDNEGKFKESLVSDVSGILSLYEASFLGIQGEDILDQALTFTTDNLSSMISKMSHEMAEEVSFVLVRPIRKRLERLDTRHFINTYQNDDSHNSILLRFAKLDFNILQRQHQEELRGIHEWDINLITRLPKPMKMLYGLFVNMFNEIEEAVSKDGRSFATSFVKEALDATLKGYLTEAKWRDEDYFPKLEEYMEVSLVTTCYPLLATVSFLGMVVVGTKDSFEWISNGPNILKASSIICRLMDDIVSHEFEQHRKHIPSAVECYMEKHKVSEEVVVELFNEEIKNAWKDINKDFLRPQVVARPLLDRILNFARAMDVIYKVEDGYTNSYVLSDYVSSVLKEAIV
ncbi:Alpha-copaene synthase [Linum perenne]